MSQRSRRSSSDSLSHADSGSLGTEQGSSSVPGSARTEAVVKQGVLQKRGRRVRAWQPRWVVLEDNFLSYFEDSSAGRARRRPKGVILLEECSARPGSEPLAIDLVTPSRSYQFRANNAGELEGWIQAISVTAERARAKRSAFGFAAHNDDDDDDENDDEDDDDDESVVARTPRGGLVPGGAGAEAMFAADGWRVLQEGWLEKKGAAAHAQWRARWCVLAERAQPDGAGVRGVSLFYLVPPLLQPSQAKGSIDMRTATALRVEEDGSSKAGAGTPRSSITPRGRSSQLGRHVLHAHQEAAAARATAEAVTMQLCVVTAKRVWRLRAPHPAAHEAWLDALRRAQGASRGHAAPATSPPAEREAAGGASSGGDSGGWVTLGRSSLAGHQPGRSSLVTTQPAAVGGAVPAEWQQQPGRRDGAINGARPPHLTRC